jgi:hypothetical protein
MKQVVFKLIVIDRGSSDRRASPGCRHAHPFPLSSFSIEVKFLACKDKFSGQITA